MRFCSMVLTILLATLTSLTGQTKGPSVSFENTDRDVGKIPQGETIKQVFTFTNNGPGTLEILNVGHS